MYNRKLCTIKQFVKRLPVMTEIKYELEIDTPLRKVYEYYTDPENIKKIWPSDIRQRIRGYIWS